jgi:hypothetical protein
MRNVAYVDPDERDECGPRIEILGCARVRECPLIGRLFTQG